MATDTAYKTHWPLPSVDLCKRARTPRIEAAPLLPYGALVLDATLAEGLDAVMEALDRDYPGRGFTREFIAKALLHTALVAARRDGMGPAMLRMEAPPRHPGWWWLAGMVFGALMALAGVAWGAL